MDCGGDAEGVADGEAALLHGGGGQGGEADDIAGGVDVRDFGLVVRVDLEALAVVGDEADVFQGEGLGGALAADGVEQALGRGAVCRIRVVAWTSFCRRSPLAGQSISSILATFSPRRRVMPIWRIWYWNASTISRSRKSSSSAAAFDQRDADAQGAEHAGIFDADDAAADDDHATWAGA